MKESGWIRHDIGARNDVKIQKMVWKYGLGAKAIYWDLIEMLCEEGGTLPFDVLEYVSYSNGLKDTTLAENVVLNTGLFQFNKTHFWSKRLLEEIRVTQELKEKRSRGGQKSGEARRLKSADNQRDTEQVFNKCSTSVQQVPEECSRFVEPIHNNTIQVLFNNNTINSPTSVGEPEKGGVNEDLNLFNEPETDKDQNQPICGGSKAGEIKDITPDTHALQTQSNPPKKVDCDSVKDYWNKQVTELAQGIPKMAKLTDVRRTKIQVRFTEFAELNPEDPWAVFVELMNKIVASKFLRGDNNRGWRIDSGWLFDNERNWVKVYEGKYDNRELSPTQQGRGQRGQDSANDEWL